MSSICRAKDPAYCRYHGVPKSRRRKMVAVPEGTLPTLSQTGDKGYKNENIFLRTMVALSTGNENLIQDQMSLFQKLPLTSRTLAMRSLTSSEFVSIARTLFTRLKKDLNVASPKFTMSENNRLGSDLYEMVSGTSIELKLGSETAVNAGLGAIKAIFDDKSFTLFPTSAQRNFIEKTYKPENEERLLKLQKLRLAQIQKKMNLSYRGKRLGRYGQFVLNSYFHGITNLQEIQSNYNSADVIVNRRNVRKYALSPDLAWDETTRNSADTRGSGQWIVTNVFLGKSTAARLTILIKNAKLGYTFKMVLNGKNNGKKFGTNTPAKLLLSSFNCWFSPIKTDR